MKYPRHLENHIKDYKEKFLSTMTLCASNGDENIELYYFGSLIDVKGEKSKFITDTDDKPMIIVAKYKDEEFVIHDNSIHGYDNMFCDEYTKEQVENRPLTKFEVSAKKFIVEIGYSIDYDDEIDDYDYNDDGDVVLIDERTMSFDDVRVNGYDYIGISYVDNNDEVIQFVDIELA